jgi:hypothetical protein
MALAGDAQACAVRDTRGDADLNGLTAVLQATPAALSARAGSSRPASTACPLPLNAYRCLEAADGIHETYTHDGFHVGPLERARTAGPSGLLPEDLRKQISEIALKVGAGGEAGGIPSHRALTLAGCTELVIGPPLFRVGEDAVGLRDSLEPLLGGLVTGIYVRMILSRQAFIGLANRL